MVVVPVYGFVSLRKQVRYSGLMKKRAALRYAGMVFAPMLAYTAIFVLAVGVEKLSGLNLISEEIARSFPLAIALGIVLWLLSVSVFVVGTYFVRSSAASVSPKQ